MYPYQNNMRRNFVSNKSGDRFLFPFLVGAVTGGAAIGLTRPRPVFVNQPYYNPNYYPANYGYYNYGYYTPYPYYR